MCTYTANMKFIRTLNEIVELTVVANDHVNKKAAKRAKVLLQMNDNPKGPGNYYSFDDRMKDTMASLQVSKTYVKSCLRVFNASGINGIKRENLEVKPDVQDRKKDKVPGPVLEHGTLPKAMNRLAGYEETTIKKAAELAGISVEDADRLKDALSLLGIALVPVNPTLVQHMQKDKKHAEIGGIYLGYRFGVFAVAFKSAETVSLEDGLDLKEVFDGTESCDETIDSIGRLFEGTKTGPVSCGAEGHRKLDEFFSGLQRVYPHQLGWNVHCYVLDEQAMTDPETGAAVIHGLPDVEGFSYEKTVHLCDFTSPMKAVFQLSCHRDNTNVQGWKLRDQVTSLLRSSTASTEPILYIGAQAEVLNPAATTIEMYAKITRPDGEVIFVNTRRQELPSFEDMGSETLEDFQDAASQMDFIASDIAMELAGNTLQTVLSTAQSQNSEGSGLLKPILVEAESGRRMVWVSDDIAKHYGQREMMYTNNFMDLAAKDVMEQSYRKSVDKLNRHLHRKAFDEVHFTTLQDKIARDGLKIQKGLEEECVEGLETYDVKIENGKIVSHKIPESAIHPDVRENAIPAYDWKKIEKRLKKRNRNRSDEDQLTLEQVREILATMEVDPQKTVYVMFDGVLVKKQKEYRKERASQPESGETMNTADTERTEDTSNQAEEGKNSKSDEQTPKKSSRESKKNTAQKPAGEQVENENDKKTVETHTVYILYQNKAYILMGATMEEACRNALGFLLKKGLLEGNELVFFSDGATVIKKTVKRYFGFRKYHFFLDYYHVEKKLYQSFTQFLKGGKARLEENKRIRGQFFQLLWEGKFKECKEFILNINPSIVKSPAAGQSIIDYLERKMEDLYCFEVRKLAGLINSSNRVEQTNNSLVSHRQKKNGMAWCPAGSRSLAATTMIYKNRIQAMWYKKGVVEFEMFETKVPRMYMPIPA